jgi:hypothetical protein
MDGLSVAAGIVAIIQIAGSVITVLSDIRDAPKESRRCRKEASSFNTLLISLDDFLSASTSTEPWFNKVQALADKDGPLDQYRLALESLLAKVEPKGKVRKTLNVLLWIKVKEDVALVLARMERAKTHIMSIFQITNMYFVLNHRCKRSLD